MERGYAIDRDAVSATVSEDGGALRTVTVDGRALLDPDLPCAGWVLAPWPNRIRDGRYTFDGVEHHLPLSEPARRNAIHGLVAERRWERVAQGPGSVDLRCDLPPSPGYPYVLALRTRYTATDRGVRAEHEVENVGQRTAPFAFGVHPYLLVPGVAVDALVLTLGARARLATDERLLPIEEVDDARFLVGAPIGDAEIDAAFAAASGPIVARVVAPDGRGVEITADAGFRWWQVYTSHRQTAPLRRRSLAVEPMTAPPDAFRSGADLLALGPGEGWRGVWEVRAC